MLLPLIQRHPRYSLTTGLGLLFTLLFIASQNSSFPNRFQTSGGGPRGGFEKPFEAGGSLAQRLEQSEADFQVHLTKRKEFVYRTGPSPGQIEAFPGNGKLYTLWDYFLPAYQCPHRVKRVGTMGDGGKYVCGLERVAAKKKPCVIYSVGINGESSFEADMLDNTNCEVWGYDFSVKSFGPEIDKVPALKARSHFFAYGLSGTDDHGPGANPPMYTLPTLMKINGHDFIDVLKIDIEGYEFSVLTDLMREFKGRPLPFGQLQLEIHAWGKSFAEFQNWWESLEESGLRAFWTEPNLVYLNLYRGHAPDLSEYAFINVKGSHVLISENPEF